MESYLNAAGLISIGYVIATLDESYVAMGAKFLTTVAPLLYPAAVIPFVIAKLGPHIGDIKGRPLTEFEKAVDKSLIFLLSCEFILVFGLLRMALNAMRSKEKKDA